jgi:LmbE family N-acetylglucosaminyl deacetylase
LTRGPQAAVVVLSPHPDDAVLSAWSVLTRDADVRVVNVCAAVPPPGPPPPWDVLSRARDGAERMRERLAEDATALAQAARRAVNLDFLDAHYRRGPIDRGALEVALRAEADTASELWAPAGIGGHPDHVAVREAALAVAGDGGPPVHLYAELPYAARRGWPRWVTGRAERRGLDLDGWLRSQLPPGTAVPGEPHSLSRAQVRRKLRALREYRTQWDALAAEGTLEDRRVLRYEVSFTAPAAGGLRPSGPGDRSASPTAPREV